MTGKELLTKLLTSYQYSYDIEQPYYIYDDVYAAHASFNATSSKYVLSKKAELWRVDCFEHTLFQCVDCLSVKNVESFLNHVTTYIEPELVCHGKPCPEQNHMYTYITGIFICDQGVSEEAKRLVKKYHFLKNYRWGIRGYSEVRLIIFDLHDRKIFGNRAAKEIVKGYARAKTI